ncbi:MAG: alpha/beta fold hydrolase [Thermoanaerobaculia bacterium]
MTKDLFIEGPQGRLHLEDGGGGSGVPVLFVHGNGANLTQWRAQLDHVRKTRRAVAFDLRGMGKSDPARNHDYSVAAMTDDVQAVADATDLKRFVIVGHSYGGAVVAAYAGKHPERVAGVLFADSAGNVKIPPEAAEKFLAALRANKDAVAAQWFAPILENASDEVKKAVLDSVHNASAEAFAGALDGMRSFDIKPALDAFHGPRIAIAATPLQGPAALNVQFPEIPAKKIDGVSHWLMMDKPEEFNRLLDEFLNTIH